MSVPKPQRIRKAQDFLAARSHSQVVHCKAFIFQLRLNAGAHVHARFGVIASRRVGNAVKRNLGKRQLRSIFMHCQAQLPARSDCIVILRSNFNRYRFVDLEQQFLSAVSRLANSSKPGAASASAG